MQAFQIVTKGVRNGFISNPFFCRQPESHSRNRTV